MQVLVAVASRHGATLGIGEAIAAAIRSEGHVVDLREVESVTALDGYDAVVLGSGVYAGRWLGAAREFIDRFDQALAERPVWLFSSGPLGDPPKPADDPVDVMALVERSGARGHRLFAGMLDRGRLGLAERAIVAVVRAPDGDFRAWPQIEAWAKEILTALEPARRTAAS
jgi:menaquinone-dependent protoporphyrinogen oxidase